MTRLQSLRRNAVPVRRVVLPISKRTADALVVACAQYRLVFGERPGHIQLRADGSILLADRRLQPRCTLEHVQ